MHRNTYRHLLAYTHTLTRAQAHTHAHTHTLLLTHSLSHTLGHTLTHPHSHFHVVHTGAQAIAAGDGHSMVLKTDGTVWATGWNEYGQLGDRTKVEKETFVKVSSGWRFTIRWTTGGMRGEGMRE